MKDDRAKFRTGGDKSWYGVGFAPFVSLLRPGEAAIIETMGSDG